MNGALLNLAEAVKFAVIVIGLIWVGVVIVDYLKGDK
jgi:hypothetical protein